MRRAARRHPRHRGRPHAGRALLRPAAGRHGRRGDQDRAARGRHRPQASARISSARTTPTSPASTATRRAWCSTWPSDEGRAELHAHRARRRTRWSPTCAPRRSRSWASPTRRCAQCNRSIVCVALTGYGLDGPYAENPAYDYVIQAMTGVMALTGDPSAPPTKAGYSAVDNSAGIMAAMGLLAKIVEGRGGQVDVVDVRRDAVAAQLPGRRRAQRRREPSSGWPTRRIPTSCRRRSSRRRMAG